MPRPACCAAWDLAQSMAKVGLALSFPHQEHIPTMAGTTRPTTNRVLRDAEPAGAIRTAS